MAAVVNPGRGGEPDCVLRRMVAGDLPRVLELERALFPADAWTDATFRDEMSQRGRHYVVAVTSDPGAAGVDLAPALDDTPPEPRVVGYAGLRTVPPEADIQTVAVAPSHWGRGIGALLLRHLLEEAERRGAVDTFLEVRADNARAQRLYRRFGFVEIGVRRGYYNDGVDAIVMHRPPSAEKERIRG